MGSKLRWITIGITGLLSYLLASAPGQKLLFFENVFTEPVHAFVFSHSALILIILLAAYIAVEIIISFRNKNRTLVTQCYNICRYIYKYTEKRIGSDFCHDLRVTIFKAMRANTEKVFIKAISRFQTKEPFKKAKVEFLPGEGAAGCCFQAQTLVYANLPEYNERNAEAYYAESYKTYKMEPEMVSKLNVKSCVILGIPIKCFDTEKTWGALVLDSTKKDSRFDKEFAREIERIIEHYTAFFTEGDK